VFPLLYIQYIDFLLYGQDSSFADVTGSDDENNIEIESKDISNFPV